MSWFSRLLSRFGLARPTSGLTIEPGAAVAPVPAAQPTTPDQPVAFGYKANWLAIRTTDGQAVCEVLGLRKVEVANWAAGLATAFASPGDFGSTGKVFVTPSIDGWTFVVGMALPYPVDHNPAGGYIDIGRRFRAMFLALAARFEDVQFFGSYRVADFYAWARAIDGTPVRVFAWNGSEGEVLANEGAQTPEERALGFVDLGLRDPPTARDYIWGRLERRDNARETADGASVVDADDAEVRIMPDEDDVISIAEAWGFNPLELERPGLAPGVGLVGDLS